MVFASVSISILYNNNRTKKLYYSVDKFRFQQPTYTCNPVEPVRLSGQIIIIIIIIIMILLFRRRISISIIIIIINYIIPSINSIIINFIIPSINNFDFNNQHNPSIRINFIIPSINFEYNNDNNLYYSVEESQYI